MIVGRTSYYFIPHSVKVFLDVALEEGAKRIFNEKREKEKFKTLSEAVESIKAREESDSKRYKKYYNINISEPKNFDLIIDTTKIPADEVVDKIIAFVKKK